VKLPTAKDKMRLIVVNVFIKKGVFLRKFSTKERTNVENDATRTYKPAFNSTLKYQLNRIPNTKNSVMAVSG
jgi:hypothetical protein